MILQPQVQGTLLGLHPQVQGALVGAIVAGVFALVVGLLAYRREEKRRLEDHRQRDADWFREKLLEAYSGCLYYLVKLGISAVTKSTEDKEVRQHFAEVQRYLLLLRAYSTDETQVQRLRECSKKLATHWDQTRQLAEQADAAADVIKALLEQDRRVKPPDVALQPRTTS